MNDEGNTSVPPTTLESVLNTTDLDERAFRPPNFEAENTALLALAQHMADSPNSVLQKLVEIAMETCGAGSAGVSLVNKEGTEFYWPAVAGEWKPYTGGGTPRNFGPSGIVVDRHAV
ncbi:MAG TPA: hypothetical protein VFS39_16920, partial [Nitrospira sp.]|nr:hypothetical protein [Nitrospira sp.]